MDEYLEDILFNGHYFLHELSISFQLTETTQNFDVILATREEWYKKRFVKCFSNVICFRHLEILHSSSFWPFLIFRTIFSWR